MMIGRTILMAAVVALAAATAQAQDPRVEVSGTAGWTFSDGVSGSAGDGSAVRVDPKDAFSWGVRLGFMVSPNVEVGGLFNMQKTDLEASGIVNISVPQSIYNYHGYVAYNFGEADAKARPYVLGGLGATQYGALKTSVGDIGGQTKFSSTWALGLKLYPGRNVGIRLEGRWTPTYIKSDAAGYWCDPYWGCYTIADAQYANQFELSGGITLRF
jgi:opacity protein-like surface antigen